MPITLETREKGWIIHYKFMGTWSLKALMDLIAQQESILDSADHTVHVIINVTRSNHFPSDVMRVHNVRALRHPRLGFVVVIGPRMVTRRLAEMIFRLARFTRGHLMDSEDQAMTFLREAIRKEQAFA